MTKILLVEDQQHFTELVGDWLNAEGYMVDSAGSGPDALLRLKQLQYDLILLDVNLPGLDGIDVCRTFRQRGGTTPIIMLTVKQSIDDKELGFDAGADDYLPKPFHMRELSARIKAVLKRSGASTNDAVVTAGKVQLFSTEHRVTFAGETIELLPKEFALLEFLMRHPNQVFSAESLVQRVWPSAAPVSAETIRSHMTRIRQKLDVEGDTLIVTIHGVGYRLQK